MLTVSSPGAAASRRAKGRNRAPGNGTCGCCVFVGRCGAARPAAGLHSFLGYDLVGYTRRFSNCMLRPRPRISLVKTSKLAGVPASRVFSPLTIDS